MSNGAIHCNAQAFVTGRGSEHAGSMLLDKLGTALVGATFPLRK